MYSGSPVQPTTEGLNASFCPISLKELSMTYIEELQDAIRKLHGAEPVHVKSVPVKEVFQGQTVWDGIVEIFELEGHPQAKIAYAWSHDTDDPKKSKRHVTVLHVPPVTCPEDTVRAAIIQQFREEFKARGKR